MSRYLLLQGTVASLAFALAWCWIAAAPMAWQDPEYPVWRAKLTLLASCELGDVLVVGDSRAAVDVMPPLLPVATSNLAVGGGMAVEAYLAVSRALACPRPPRRVVISLDAAHFAMPDLFWERSVKYGFVTTQDLQELSKVQQATGDWSLGAPKRPDGLPAWLRGRLYALRFSPFYFASLVKGGIGLRWWHNQQRYARAIATRGQYFFGRDAGSSGIAIEGRLERFAPLPVLDRYFDRMLRLLVQRDIPVDFVAMPMNHATSRAVQHDVRAGFAAYLASYQARYSNFHVIGPAMPAWPDRYFGDEFSHLNPTGAALLSVQFGQCLRQRMASAEPGECIAATAD